MINFIDERGKEILEIEFEKGLNSGTKLIGEFSICPNPVCHCEEMFYEADIQNQDQIGTKGKLSFGINPLKKEIVKNHEKTILEKDFKCIIKLFSDLSSADWDLLRNFYLEFKRAITINTPFEQIKPEFSVKNIEIDGSMIGYYEIFPYAEEINIEVDNISYMIDDQYCIKSNCSCKDSILSFLPRVDNLNENKIVPPYIRLDYNKKKWEIESPGFNMPSQSQKIMTEVIKNNYSTIFKKRHILLKKLYQNYLKDSPNRPDSIKNNKIVKQNKTGRNELCPCGSGKKYKKCCM